LNQEIIEVIDDGVGLITLNRPESLNALNPPMMRALTETAVRLAEDQLVRCVVVTGAGKGFCAGGDVKASGRAASQEIEQDNKSDKRARSVEEKTAWLRRSMEASRILHQMKKPTIAMINGACAGAGLSLAGACDFRFCNRSARFVSAFARGGLSGDYGGSWFWSRILGTARARELYMLGEKLNAQQALEMGLVHRVYEDTDLQSMTMSLAKQLARLPGEGLAYMKENLNAAETSSLEEVFDLEAKNMMLSRKSLNDLARK
jgi:2-(1,2-epoxy-1,2-dihydrophenyl)acetyl-CoA isomerase